LEDIENTMRKVWIAVLLLIFLVPIAVVSAEGATHATHDDDQGNHRDAANGSGTIIFTTTGTISGPTTRGENTVTVVKETLQFSGNLSGTALTIERQVKHNDTDDGTTHIFTTFHGHGNFTGTLNGATVTLRIRYEGVSNSTFTRGNFVVSGHTSQNITAHAEGHFQGTLVPREGSSSGITYTMHSHVATHPEHPETDDDDRNDD
jgi:hypothetical protein